MKKRSYQTPPSLSVSRNTLLEKSMKPLAVKSVGTGISNFRTVISCYRYLTQFVHWTHIFCIFIFFSKVFPCSRLLDCSCLIHNLEFSLSKPKNGPLDCGKACFLTIRKDVAHLTVMKTKAALFLQKGWAPRYYRRLESSFPSKKGR